MKHPVKFAFLAIVVSGITVLSACGNPQNENRNQQDSINNEMMAPPDTAMDNMSDTTMDGMDTVGGMDTVATP